MPALQVQAGPSLQDLKDANVNDDAIGLPIDSEYFTGKLILRVKHYKAPDGSAQEDTTDQYFTKHQDATWSIQIQGSFKQDVDLDDLMFGNVWHHPIRDRLPYGTSVALRFLNWYDPAMELDLQADSPWAMSPLISTMQSIRVTDSSAQAEQKSTDVAEDVTPLFKEDEKADVKQLAGDPEARRKYFSTPEHRKGRILAKDTYIQADFRNGFIDFENGVYLKLPVGFKLDLLRLWDGKALQYVCTSRDRQKTYFAVSYFLVLDS